VHCRCIVTDQNQHEPWCHFGKHSDAAKRVWETYNMHRLFNADDGVGKWIACALEDGSSDNTLYDSKYSAVRHQKNNEANYTFIKIAPTTMRQCEAEVMLKTARNLHKAGLRLADPDHKHGGMDVIKRLAVEDQLAQMRGRNTNLIMPWEG